MAIQIQNISTTSPRGNNKQQRKYLKVNYVGGANIGDGVFPYMLHKEGIPFSWSSHLEHKKIISTGSILAVGSKRDTIIWGSGIISAEQKMHPDAIPYSVRGKYSAGACNKDTLPLGDPALALPHFFKEYQYKDVKKQSKIGLIPHLIEFDDVLTHLRENGTLDRYKVIRLNAFYDHPNYEEFLREVISCEKVISTSLHGLVIANAFGIPAAWWKYSDRLMGDDIKFFDYASAFDHEIKKHNEIENINDFWCPEQARLISVQEGILNSSPMYKELDSGYYTDELVEKR